MKNWLFKGDFLYRPPVLCGELVERLADCSSASIINQNIHSPEMLQWQPGKSYSIWFSSLTSAFSSRTSTPYCSAKPIHIGRLVSSSWARSSNCQATAFLGQDRTAAFSDSPSASGHNRHFYPLNLNPWLLLTVYSPVSNLMHFLHIFT